MERAAIIPTGDEVLDGTVRDINSPAIARMLASAFPDCNVTRMEPCRDRQDEILARLESALDNGSDLVIFTGGTGGGGDCAPALAPDRTSDAVADRLPEAEVAELRGSNGHLLSKIVVGTVGGATVMTVPGPHVEAVAAVRAAIACLEDERSTPERLCRRVARAVLDQYPGQEGHEQ